MSTHPFKVHEYVAHTTEVMSMAISPKTGQVLATGGEDCKVNIWEVKSAGNIRSLGSNKAGVESLCFDPDDTIVVSGSSSGALKVFDLNEGRLSRNLVGHKTNITSLQYHPISEYVVSGSKDCNVKVWDVRNKECLSTYTGHEKEVTCVRFSPDGRWVASSAKDGTVLIWDMVAGKHLQSLKMKGPSFVTAFEFNPSEFLLAAVTNSRAVRVWNLETMEVCYTAPPEQSTIRSLAFAPGGGGGGSSSSNRQVLCTSTKDAVKSWTWADTATSHTGEYADGDNSGSRSLTLAGCMPMGPEGVAVSALRVSKSGNVTGAACVSNFVSIYRTSLADMAAAQQEAVGARAMTRQQHGSGGGSDGSKASGYNNGSSSSSSSSSSSVGGDSRPPFVLYGNPGGGGAQSPTTTQKQSQQQAARSMSGGGSSSNSSGGGGGDADRIRADRERNGGARERVVDRQEDWSAAEPKHPSSPSSQGAGGGGRRGYKSVSPSVPSAAAAAVDTPPRYQHQHQYKASMMDEEDACRAAGAGAAAAGAAAAAAGGGGRPPAHLFAPSPEGGSEAKNSGGGYPGKSSCSSAGQQQHENDGGYKMQSTPPRHHEDKQHQHQMELHKLMPINSDSRFERVNSPVDVGMATGAGAGAMGSPSSSSSSVLTRTGALRELGAAVAGPAGGERATRHDHHHHHEESQSRPRSAAAALNSPTKHAGSGGGGSGSGTAVRARLGSGGPSSSNSIITNNSNSSSLAAADPAAALDGVLASSRAFASALSKRLVDVRVLRKFWNRGDLEDVIDHLETIQGAAHHDALHLVVLADFFGSVQLRGNGLCLDSCLRLMPLLEAMLAYAQKGAELGGSGSLAPASGHVVASAVNAFSSLVAAFGDLIKDTCTTHETSAHAGVDLSREARFKKCKVCLEVMRGVRKRVPALKGQFDGDGAMQQRLLDFQNTLVKAM